MAMTLESTAHVIPQHVRPIRIVLIDHHRILTESLSNRINSSAGLNVVGITHNAEEGFRSILATCPDIAILDVDLPDRSPFDLASEIATRQEKTRMILLASRLPNIALEQALRVGVRGLLLKQDSIDVLLECIKRVFANRVFISDSIQNRVEYDPAEKRYALREEGPMSKLTNRQLEVLRHLALGHSVKEVARRMHLSEKSVDSHKYRIMHRLNIHDRVELARFAIREGLVQP